MGKKSTRTRLGPQPLRVAPSCRVVVRQLTSFKLTSHCGRRLNDVATVLPMRQCKAGHSTIPAMTPFHRLAEVEKPPIRAQRRAVFAHGDGVDQRSAARCRLPLRLVQSFSGLPTGLQGSPRRRLRSLPTVKCRSHTRKCVSSRFCGGQSGGLVLFVSSLGLYHRRLWDHHTPRALPRSSPW